MALLTRILMRFQMIAMVGCASLAFGGDRVKEKVPPVLVDLFAGQEDGTIDVRLIAKSSEQATVVIKNKGKNPVRVQLPAAFAGLPVLAQVGLGQGGGFGGQGGGLGGGGLGGGGLGGGGLGGGAQGIGGGFGGQGGGLGGGGLGGGGLGGGGLGGGGGVFHVGPEATGRIRLSVVCLEHGKKDPTSRIPYKLVPIESVTQDQRLIEVCRMLGRGEIDQVSAQASAWHFANGLSWQELASKVKVKHMDGSVEMYFSAAHMARASEIVQAAILRAEAYSQANPSRSLADPVDQPETISASGK